jgi:hypothetical protein
VHVDANMVHGWPLPFCGVDLGAVLMSDWSSWITSSIGRPRTPPSR